MRLFFDFDGTLADSSPGIYASFELACDSLGLAAPTYGAFRDRIGPPVQQIARHFFPGLTEQQVETFRQTFRHDYDTIRFRQCQWYDGVATTIETLVDAGGARLAIITNKPTQPTLELLSTGGLTQFFDLVVGIDYQVTQGTGPVFSSKSEAIRHAHSQLPKSDSEGVYIGDTPSDRSASLSCGMQFIAVTYGFHRWQMNELGSSSHVEKIGDLIPLLMPYAPVGSGIGHHQGA